ncbi:MAG: MipA/OmpV family protein [Hyphomicrobiales bacterium]|nr:MipA/OmpV family protein [Hyphomicrobiales bacterium]
MSALKTFAVCGLCLVGGAAAARADNFEPVADVWVVTIGGYVVGQPDYEGSDDHEAAFKPIFNITRKGSKEYLDLPDDAGGFAIVDRGGFRFGPAFGFRDERDRGDNKDLRGLNEVDFTFELGVFAEYWPTENFRTRVELLQGLNGHEGFLANFSADAVVNRGAWTFTAGPRLTAVSSEYQEEYFSVSAAESVASGLNQFDAEGGLHSAGVTVSASYQFSDRLALKAYAEYDRLLDDASDSPIVDDRGSEDQFAIGIGAAYKFEFSR